MITRFRKNVICRRARDTNKPLWAAFKKEGKKPHTGLFKLWAVPPPRAVGMCCRPPGRGLRKGCKVAALRAPSLGPGRWGGPARTAA